MTQLMQPCSACDRARAALRELQKYASQWSNAVGVMFDKRIVDECDFAIICSACNNTGKVPTVEGKAIVELITTVCFGGGKGGAS